MALVSVIILNWNGRTYLDDCLNSLNAQKFRDFEVVLVENGSLDGSAEYVRKQFPWVRLLALSQNTGFAEGNNRGLNEASGEFIVTLNNDTKVEPEFLEELLKPALEHPRVGMVAPKMLNFIDRGRIDSVGIEATTAGMGLNRGVGEQDNGQFDVSTTVFGPCAGAALYRKQMLNEIGFFDSDFFAYYEDLDLAWRGRMAGWEAITAPLAVVYHVHSASSGRMTPFTIYQVQRNKWYVLLKNWSTPLLLRHCLRIVAFDAAALLLAVLRGRCTPALRARLHLLRDLPRLLRKRREVANLRKIRDDQVAPLLIAGHSPFRTFARKMGNGI